MRRRAGIERELPSRADQRVLRWFGNVKRMDEYRMTRRVLICLPITRPCLLGPVLFRTAVSCSGGYHLERGGIPLHDAVGISCKNGATTEYQRVDVEYMG